MTVEFPRLYVIIDAALLGESALDVAVQLAGAGVGIIQYRDKAASSGQLWRRCSALAAALRATGARFIVNDRADVAAVCGAEGAHLGQNDLPLEAARRILPAPRWLGISTHNLEQLRAAAATSADYLAVGPVFATATKRGHEPVVGTEFVQRAREETHKPLVAIGGITLATAREVWAAGADSVAVAGDILLSGNPAARAREYLHQARDFFAARD
jgi:thiamine-phosphate pyrophosphorylase